jgi:hypothetical protein
MLFLESTADGSQDIAIVAYAGLRATAGGTEPADWMSAVLRDRNLSIEQSLATLSDAMQREMLPRLGRGRAHLGPLHDVVAAAFVNNEPRVYLIDHALSTDRTGLTFQFTQRVVSTENHPERVPRFTLAGSGARLLRGLAWRRRLGRLVGVFDRRLILAETVADAMAGVNDSVSRSLADGTVGPHCIVAWRGRRCGVHNGGGGCFAYTGVSRDPAAVRLPTIGNVLNDPAITQVSGPHA